MSRDKILYDSWSILEALSRVFYARNAILKAEKTQGTRLHFKFVLATIVVFDH